MKLLKNVGLVALGATSAAIAGFGGRYATRLKSLGTLKQHTNYADGYNLYSMKVCYKYNLNRILESNITDNDSFINAIIQESAPHLPVKMEAPNFACSAFTLNRACEGATENESNAVLMGRNYDFKFDTSALVVECSPKNGYKSIALAALNNVHADNPMQNAKKRLACLGAPFICLDGVNECGVSIAVLTLDSNPVNQCSGKRKITTSLAIRLVLDRASTTKDAIELLSEYDMFATSGRDYHFYISDAAGNGCVVEWDPLDSGRKMIVTPMRAITNFYAAYKDKVKPNQKNGMFGHGKERYLAIENVLGAKENMSNVQCAWKALHASAQEPNPQDITSNTQWSAVYNNECPSVCVALRRHWDDKHTFSL